MPEHQRPLKVFLCHASADKPKVRDLYRFLKRRGIQPWLDAEDLLPGQAWQVEIPKAIEMSDAIIIFLSHESVDKEGYVQKEIKFALDRALEMPEGRIFIIPARLEECDVPRSISGYHWVDLFDDSGYDKLMKSLKLRVAQLERANIIMPKSNKPNSDLSQEPEVESKNISVRVEGDVQGNIIRDNNSIQTPVVAHNMLHTSSIIDGLNWKHTSKSVIFDQRLRDAFPGLRSVKKFENKDAVDRLKILLRAPLIANSSSPEEGTIIPFWWFRGTSHMYIKSFQELAKETILMDKEELRIDYIVAVREFSDEKRNFVYVQSLPDKPTGLYPFISEKWLHKYLQEKLEKDYGYYFFEEYAIWNGNLITREEYDDGSALIYDKPTQVKGAELRLRYITPYNFIVCGQDHVLNTSRTELEQTKLLNEILLGTKQIKDLVAFVESLPSSDRFMLL